MLLVLIKDTNPRMSLETFEFSGVLVGARMKAADDNDTTEPFPFTSQPYSLCLCPYQSHDNSVFAFFRDISFEGFTRSFATLNKGIDERRKKEMIYLRVGFTRSIVGSSASGTTYQ